MLRKAPGVALQLARRRRDRGKQLRHRRALVTEELAADKVVCLDAGGALVDRRDPRIAPMLSRAGLLNVAHPAMDLHAERGNVDAVLGAPAFGDWRQEIDLTLCGRAHRFVWMGMGDVVSGGDLIEQTAHGIDPGLHGGQHAPHVRMMDDGGLALAGKAERRALHAVARIGERLLIGALRDGKALQPDIEAGVVHHREHIFEAAVRLAYEFSPRSALVAEGENSGRAAVNAELVLEGRADDVVRRWRRSPAASSSIFGTMNSEMPLTPGGASGSRASTRWMMLRVISWSP